MHVMYTRPFLSSHKTARGNEAMGNHAVTEWEEAVNLSTRLAEYYHHLL